MRVKLYTPAIFLSNSWRYEPIWLFCRAKISNTFSFENTNIERFPCLTTFRLEAKTWSVSFQSSWSKVRIISFLAFFLQKYIFTEPSEQDTITQPKSRTMNYNLSAKNEIIIQYKSTKSIRQTVPMQSICRNSQISEIY